jgi:hypothetical protein
LVGYLLMINNAFFLIRDEYIFTEKTTIIELRVPTYTLMMKLRNRTKLKTQSSSQISYRKTILLYKKIWLIWGTSISYRKTILLYKKKSDRSEVHQILQENHLIIQKNLTDLRYIKSYRKTILLYKKIWPIWDTSNLTGKPFYYSNNLTDLRYVKSYRKTILLYKTIWPI